MSRSEASIIFEDNINSIEGSFIYLLLEDCRFDEASFKKLINAIQCLMEADGVEEGMVLKLFKLHSTFLNCIIYHYQESDLYSIKNFPDDIKQYTEKLNALVDEIFNTVHIKSKEH